MKKTALRVALLVGAVAAAAVGRHALADDAAPPDKQAAVAIIHGAGDNKDKITGTVSFVPAGDGVKVVADIKGLTPGKHGIHIHEKSDLSSPDLKSAGPHFNPGGAHHHGGPDDADHHAGDLGNIEADADGNGHLEIIAKDLSIEGSGNGVVGHSVIIHAGEDDLKSQPAGKSGDRIAGGAINVRNAAGRQPARGKD
jgi:Cu-Zn family superoxide dismutase